MTRDRAFLIDAIDRFRKSHEIELELDVCLNCLESLGFEGFERVGVDWEVKWKVRDEFSLTDFFEANSTHFRQLPRYSDENAPPSGYTDNWTAVSRAYKKRQGWSCESCGLDLSDRADRLCIVIIRYERDFADFSCAFGLRL